MANKQIKDYAAVTALEDTDSFPLQTIAPATRRTTLAELKENLDGRYQQFGEVIWEDEDGATSITLTLDSNKVFDIYVAANDSGTMQKIIRIKTIISTDEVNIPFPYYLGPPDFESVLYTIYIGYGTITSPNNIKIYKIVEYEV